MAKHLSRRSHPHMRLGADQRARWRGQLQQPDGMPGGQRKRRRQQRRRRG